MKTFTQLQSVCAQANKEIKQIGFFRVEKRVDGNHFLPKAEALDKTQQHATSISSAQFSLDWYIVCQFQNQEVVVPKAFYHSAKQLAKFHSQLQNGTAEQLNLFLRVQR